VLPNQYLEVPQLGEWLSAVVELASIWLSLQMNHPVGSHVSPLSEILPADVAMVRTLASMAALVCLEMSGIFCKQGRNITNPEVPHLGEFLIAYCASLTRLAVVT
jgi:hypothetical protein